MLVCLLGSWFFVCVWLGMEGWESRVYPALGDRTSTRRPPMGKGTRFLQHHGQNGEANMPGCIVEAVEPAQEFRPERVSPSQRGIPHEAE